MEYVSQRFENTQQGLRQKDVERWHDKELSTQYFVFATKRSNPQLANASTTASGCRAITVR